MGNARDMWKKTKKTHKEINKKNFKLNFGPTLDKWQYLDADHADLVNQIERLCQMAVKNPKLKPKIEKALPKLNKKTETVGKKANVILNKLAKIQDEYLKIAKKMANKDLTEDLHLVNKELLKTKMPLLSIYQLGLRPGSGKLVLGDHKIADQLRNLDISMTAIVTKNYLSKYLILPAGEPMGIAEGSHSGYVGQDLDFGRLTISYDNDRGPIDLYSGMESTISN